MLVQRCGGGGVDTVFPDRGRRKGKGQKAGRREKEGREKAGEKESLEGIHEGVQPKRLY